MALKFKIGMFVLFSLIMEVNSSYATNPISVNEEHKTMDSELRWDIMSATSGIAGLVLIFMPYISIIGLLFCIASIVLGFKARKKKQKKLWIRLGFFSGGLGLLAFLGVLGLILFF